MTKITNWYYSVNGTTHWFVGKTEALIHFSRTYTDIYRKCIDPEKYIQKLEKIYPFGG